MRNEAEEKRPAAGSEKGPGRPKQIRARCPHCHGTGKDIVKIPGKTKPSIKPCPVCGGKGFVIKTEVKEQAPTNSVGTSSSLQGTGNVSTYDPVQPKVLRRKASSVKMVGKPIGTGSIDKI